MMKKLINKAVPKLYGFYFNALSLFSKRKASTLALKVFSVPRAGKIAEFQKEFLNSSRKQQLITEEGFIQIYHWKGSGKTVFLAHGWESNAWRWKYLIEPLLKLNYNIIAIDAPAHGASSGKEFTAVKYSGIINQMINLYKPEIIIAHSVGAMATVYQESLEPHDFVEKMVLLGGPDRLELIMKGYQQLVGFNDRVYSGLDKLLHDKYGFYIAEFNTSKFASNLPAQVLLIHDQQDAIVDFKSMEAIAAAIPNVASYSSKTGGHSLHTPEVVDKILAFL